uniref:Uncharacterized protein n=1 Tax=Rhipicephalus appendiculatus TaxID=34631 RepID=A0A131YA42_RHIAP
MPRAVATKTLSLSFFPLHNNTCIATNAARNDKLKLGRRDNCQGRNYTETARKEQREKAEQATFCHFCCCCCCLSLCTAFYHRITVCFDLFNALLKLHRSPVLADGS